jgi:DNA replication protein DnaD
LVEKKTRDIKKENDFLIREQRRLRDETTATKAKAEELRTNTLATIEDMKQQITDITFYTRTQLKLESSELSGEMQGSNLVILNNFKPPDPLLSARERKGRVTKGRKK